MSDSLTFTRRVRDHFLARPGLWVSALELEAVGGRQAWRTRVSDARRIYGMRIENRVRTITDPDGRHWRISEYRYAPDRTPFQALARTAVDQVAARASATGRLF